LCLPTVNIVSVALSVDLYIIKGKNRLSTYIRERSEWCISRQRSWGVPIPIIYNTATDEPLLDEAAVKHSLGILEERGVNAWFDEKADANEFLPPSLRQEGQYRKGMDTMDVWFDSGTSWTMLRDSPVGEARVAHHAEAPGSEKVKQYPAWADVALEGSDQHRGWFQSLMLTAVSPTQMQNGQGVGLVKPYHTVITHGFILDEKGRKMSKSEGNVVSPLSIIHGGKVGFLAKVWMS
jgi:isoleucyl-tRNA synthetase